MAIWDHDAAVVEHRLIRSDRLGGSETSLRRLLYDTAVVYDYQPDLAPVLDCWRHFRGCSGLPSLSRFDFGWLGQKGVDGDAIFLLEVGGLEPAQYRYVRFGQKLVEFGMNMAGLRVGDLGSSAWFELAARDYAAAAAGYDSVAVVHADTQGWRDIYTRLLLPLSDFEDDRTTHLLGAVSSMRMRRSPPAAPDLIHDRPRLSSSGAMRKVELGCAGSAKDWLSFIKDEVQLVGENLRFAQELRRDASLADTDQAADYLDAAARVERAVHQLVAQPAGDTR